MNASTRTRLRHSRRNYGRAGCGETRTSGSEGDHAEKDPHTGTSPRGPPYVPELPPLLRGLPLGGWVVTTDAAHIAT